MTTLTHAAPRIRRAEVRARVAIGIGNFIEAFDFAVYGYFAATIGALFFPTGNRTTELLAALAVFGVGFVARPLGAAIFGALGDRAGRRPVLELTIIGMGITTTCIGLLPTYAAVGLLAPLLITVLRFLQGMMLAGEWSIAATYIGETSPPRRRGLHSSIVTMTAGFAFCCGVLVSTILSASLSEADLTSWGWRIPFVLSFFAAIVGLYIRRKLDDTEVFQAIEEGRRSGTIARVPSAQWIRGFLLSLATSALFGVSLYYLVTYANNHLVSVIGMDRLQALTLCTIATAFYVALHPLAGWASDRLGRRPLMLFSAFGLAVLAWPIFELLASNDATLSLIGLFSLGVLVAANAVPGVALLTELFPAQVRSRGSALGYNIGIAALAGPGPFIAAALIAATGSPIAPAWYLAGIGALCGIVLALWLPETKGADVTVKLSEPR